MRNKVERSAERGILSQQPQAEKGTTQVIWSKSFSPLKSEKPGLTKGLLMLPQMHLHVLLHSLRGTDLSQPKWAHPDITRAQSHSESTTMAKREPTHQALAQGDDSQSILGPAGQGRWLLPSGQHRWNHTWSTTSGSGLQSTRLSWIYWKKSKGRMWKFRDERFSCTMRAWGCWNCFVWRTEAGEDPTLVNTGWEGINKTEPNSFWWCPGKGQEEWEQI